MKYVDVEVPCQRCKINNTFKFYKMIDIDEDKDIYKKVDDKTLFNLKCPKCGVVDQVIYPFICYDKKKKYAILFSKENDEKKRKFQLQRLEFDEIENLDEYTTRTVDTLEDLNEKIRMFDYDLNDAIIEVAKIWFVSNSDVKINEIRFYKIEEDFIKWIVAFDGKIMGARLPMDFYRESLDDWEINIPNGFPKVNKETLEKYLKRIR